jgi:hypothetical protein
MDNTWAEFSTLDMGVLLHAKQLHLYQKQPSLKLKRQSKQFLDSLPVAFALCGLICRKLYICFYFSFLNWTSWTYTFYGGNRNYSIALTLTDFYLLTSIGRASLIVGSRRRLHLGMLEPCSQNVY